MLKCEVPTTLFLLLDILFSSTVGKGMAARIYELTIA